MMYSPFRYLTFPFWKKRPIHLTFFVTRRCNARCPYCFYLRGRDPVPEGRELSLDEISRVSRSLGGILWLAFSGGEIFLRTDLADISTVFYRNNRPSIMLFPTNGLLPLTIRDTIEEILRRCPKSVIVVKLSIDELGPRHDSIRNTPGSFDLTMETYGLLSGLVRRYPNFELGVNTVFCSENQDAMGPVIEHVRGLPAVTTHTISMVRGNLAENRYREVSPEKYHQAIARLEQDLRRDAPPVYRFRGAGIKAAQDILQRRIIHRTMREQRRIIPCFAGRLNAVLTETGHVYPCEILDQSLGNIRDHDHDLGKVLQTQEARSVIRSIRAGKCYCTHECYLMTNILFNPGQYPGLLGEYLQLGRRSRAACS